MARNNENREAILESETEGAETISHYAKYKKAHLKYQNSEKGKEARKRYMQSEKGKEARRRAQKKRAERIKQGLELLKENES